MATAARHLTPWYLGFVPKCIHSWSVQAMCGFAESVWPILSPSPLNALQAFPSRAPAYHCAKELLPHSSRLMMLSGSWSFTEETCPLRGDLRYLKRNCLRRRWRACAQLLSPALPPLPQALPPSSNTIIQRSLKISLHSQGRQHVHQHKDECLPCVYEYITACVNLILSPFTRMWRDVTWLAYWVQSLLPSPLSGCSQLGF